MSEEVEYLDYTIDKYNEVIEDSNLFWSLYRDDLSFSSPIKKGVK